MKLYSHTLTLALLHASLLTMSLLGSEPRRKVIINQDAAGPGGSNMQALLIMLQSPQVEVLGITVVSGDQWRDEEVQHTLRLLELIGRTDIPVMKGAAFPLVRTKEESELWQEHFGQVAYAGAWDKRWWHASSVVPPLPEGQPHTTVSQEDAVSFLLRMVHKYPHQITVYEGGPMTNLALAISLDPEFPRLAEELVFMGGSLNPETSEAEFVNNPRHEFNFWFDPEAAQIVLRAPWKKMVCTPVDVSLKVRLSPQLAKQLGSSPSAAAQYVHRFYQTGDSNDVMWDELAAAAWINPGLVTQKVTRFMSVDLDKGAGYGNTLTVSLDDPVSRFKSQPVEILMDVDTKQFYSMFTDLMETPASRTP